MLYGGAIGELELRRGSRGGGRRLTGSFPYNSNAVMSDGGRNGGRPRKERIAPRAFAYRVERPEEEIHLLVGHSYDRPLASRANGTLKLKDTDAALTFEADISPEILDAPYGRNFAAAFDSGLIRGISPGFRIPPPRAVPKAEEVTEEDPAEGTALIRTIFAALLYELSLVTVAAYREAMAKEEEGAEEGRSWEINPMGIISPRPRHLLNRWRL
ncbi:HK97 family phage prohead protease [Acuticoccus mangrovi]|uniref:HK97 family phage prohead protease n=1 Tax=Acuticoccus mangrovi TaxID=2796142 RepID=A0A934ITR2_9HYPH|nr:HK97 family phage prohead protease [Acuticoccus mangrovi]MBJ3777870.1 HK97 family phage prohead protease [Acuticoccus mangrovi]